MPDADEIKKKLAELKARIGQTQESIQRMRETISPEKKKQRKGKAKKA